MRFARRKPNIVWAMLLCFLILLATFPGSMPRASGQVITVWSQTQSYPSLIYLHSCATLLQYIYCVGGNNGQQDTNATYYTNAIQNGVSAFWLKTTRYPINVSAQSCVTDSGYLYCIGGSSTSPDTDYYANVSSSGIGTWKPTSPYPVNEDSGLSCVTSFGYVYCVGGNTPNAYNAPISSSGIGNWNSSPTFFYPQNITLSSCVANLGIIYCVGGRYGLSNASNVVRYGYLSTSGINWFYSTSYPLKVYGTSCVTSSGYVYCVGGIDSNTSLAETAQVYYATIASSGFGSWQTGSSFPDEIYATSCVAQGEIVCVGGLSGSLTSSVYYSSFLTNSETRVNCGTSTYSVGGTVPTCTATVFGSNPSGTVDWSANASGYSINPNPCDLSSGSCSVSFADTSAGTLSITASYMGDSANAPSQGSFVLTTSYPGTTISFPVSSTNTTLGTPGVPTIGQLLEGPLAVIAVMVAVVFLAVIYYSRRAR